MRSEAPVEKVKVFEDGQDQTGGDDAQNQVGLPPPPTALSDVDAREVVDDDRRQDDEDVDGDEHHVEEAAGGQQPGPTELVGQQEVHHRDHREEEQERVRIEEHPRLRRLGAAQPALSPQRLDYPQDVPAHHFQVGGRVLPQGVGVEVGNDLDPCLPSRPLEPRSRCCRSPGILRARRSR